MSTNGTGFGLLDHDEIVDELRANQIFLRDTWRATNVKGASYDLRIAADKLVYEDGDGRLHLHDETNPVVGPVVLQPGRRAIVLSFERFQLADDIAANIGVKFELPARGLLIHTGLPVHPGFGTEGPRDRLRFVVVNIGSEPVAFVPGHNGDEIAAIQFFKLRHPSPYKKSTGGNALEAGVFEGQPLSLPPLGWFSKITALQDLESRVDTRLEAMERGERSVVLFGVFVLAATIVGVAIAVALNSFDRGGVLEAGRWTYQMDRFVLLWTLVITVGLVTGTVLLAKRLGIATGDSRAFKELKEEVGQLRTQVAEVRGSPPDSG